MHESLVRLYEVSKKDKPSDIAFDLNVGNSTVTNWGKRGVSKDGAIAAGRVYKCDPNYILTGSTTASSSTDKQSVDEILDQIRALDNVKVDYGEDDDSGDIKIPIYDVYFCCGDGDTEEFAFEEIKGERKFPPHFFTDKGVKPENFKLVCAKNDSQKPYINEHDIVGIDISDREIKDGEMYAILLDGERMFKRIFREPGNVLRLHCYNPDYPDKIVTAENHSSLVIVGREMYRAG